MIFVALHVFLFFLERSLQAATKRISYLKTHALASARKGDKMSSEELREGYLVSTVKYFQLNVHCYSFAKLLLTFGEYFRRIFMLSFLRCCRTFAPVYLYKFRFAINRGESILITWSLLLYKWIVVHCRNPLVFIDSLLSLGLFIHLSTYFMTSMYAHLLLFYFPPQWKNDVQEIAVEIFWEQKNCKIYNLSLRIYFFAHSNFRIFSFIRSNWKSK